MEKVEQEKAITLVALIITIVVLLILAGVAVSIIKSADIIGYAKTAALKYRNSLLKEEEQAELFDKYKDIIPNNTIDKEPCVHDGSYIKTSWQTEDNDEYEHYFEKKCSICDEIISDGRERHTFNASGNCGCGFERYW